MYVVPYNRCEIFGSVRQKINEKKIITVFFVKSENFVKKGYTMDVLSHTGGADLECSRLILVQMTVLVLSPGEKNVKHFTTKNKKCLSSNQFPLMLETVESEWTVSLV